MSTFFMEVILILKHTCTTLYTLSHPPLNEACLQHLEQETPGLHLTSFPFISRSDQNLISYLMNTAVPGRYQFLYTCLMYSGLEKKYHPLILPGTTSFSFPLVELGKRSDITSLLLPKALKEPTKTCPGQAEFESFLSKG